jgi:hypothetical protein
MQATQHCDCSDYGGSDAEDMGDSDLTQPGGRKENTPMQESRENKRQGKRGKGARNKGRLEYWHDCHPAQL